MDILLIKNKIKELKDLANKTDSKREDLEYRLQIKDLERQIEDYSENLLKSFPEKVKLRVKVDKTIEYDTSDFLDYLCDYMNNSGNFDVDIDEELKDYLMDDFYPDYALDRGDYDIQIEKEC